MEPVYKVVKGVKAIIVKETPIKEMHSNGGRYKEVIFLNTKDEQFRISILSESYDFQSYAKLYKWNTVNGWNLITSSNPNKDYNVKIAYSNNYKQSAFDEIVEDLIEFSQNF